MLPRKRNSLFYIRPKLPSKEYEDLFFTLLTVFAISSDRFPRIAIFSDRFPHNNLNKSC